MHKLDSRYLNLGNCFGQKFPKAGVVHYLVSLGDPIPSAASRRGDDDDDFLITVQPARAGATPEQHDVMVSFDNGSLNVTPSKLEIHAGDGVLWHTASAQATGFQVSGYGPDFQFSSARMQDDAIYTHVFSVPGSYEWHDPNGSGASGTINVENFHAKTSADTDRWFELLKKPAAIEIKGKKISPATVNIIVGQTVFWAIYKSSGIAVSDKRLQRAEPPHQN